MRLNPGLTAAALLALASLTPRVAAQQRGTGINNFLPPAGAPTALPGTLGHVEQRGHGPQDLILIPGMSFGWSAWASFMERNADRYTMYAITLAGFDGTPPPPVPAEPEAFEQHHWTDGAVLAVRELIAREALDRPVVVGHHLLGDHLAMRLGLEHPDLVRGVVVVAGEPARAVSATLDGNPALGIEDHLIFVRRHLVPGMKVQPASEPSRVRVPAEALSRDAERARTLNLQRTSTPRHVEYRYFLEIMTTNLSLALPATRTPVLAIAVRRDADQMIERIVQGHIRRGVDKTVARSRVESMLKARFGTLERARAEFGTDHAWETLARESPSITVAYIRETGLFMMDDQPEQLDALTASFVQGLDPAATPAEPVP